MHNTVPIGLLMRFMSCNYIQEISAKATLCDEYWFLSGDTLLIHQLLLLAILITISSSTLEQIATCWLPLLLVCISYFCLFVLVTFVYIWGAYIHFCGISSMHSLYWLCIIPKWSSLKLAPITHSETVCKCFSGWVAMIVEVTCLVKSWQDFCYYILLSLLWII